jgi:hypothetical protein
MKVWKRGHRGNDPSNPQQVVQSGGRSSTGKLLTNFSYMFTIIHVVMFTIYFSLQENYKEEVVKKYIECFNYEESIDGRALYDSGGRKAHGW